jgi:hypothetical protein
VERGGGGDRRKKNKFKSRLRLEDNIKIILEELDCEVGELFSSGCE